MKKRILCLILVISMLLPMQTFAVTCDHYSNLQTVVTKAATCFEPGTIELSCKKCGVVISTTPIPALLHQLVVLEYGYDNNGVQVYVIYGCTRCGYHFKSGIA